MSIKSIKQLKEIEQAKSDAYDAEWAFRNQEMAKTPTQGPEVLVWIFHTILLLFAMFGWWPLGLLFGHDTLPGFIPSVLLVAYHLVGMILAASKQATLSAVMLLLIAAGAYWWPHG